MNPLELPLRRPWERRPLALFSRGSRGPLRLARTLSTGGGATAFLQWGQYFLFISFTACSPNFSGGNNIVLPPWPHLSGSKLPPLPYGGAAHALKRAQASQTGAGRYVCTYRPPQVLSDPVRGPQTGAGPIQSSSGLLRPSQALSDRRGALSDLLEALSHRHRLSHTSSGSSQTSSGLFSAELCSTHES